MPNIIACPSCQKQLKVPDELIGKSVKCPGCKETFTAQTMSTSSAAPAREEVVEKPRKKAAPPPEEEEDEDEAPRKPVKRRADDDDEDERPSTRGKRRGGGPKVPHRGVLILLLGIGAFVVFGPLGIVAWILGNTDIKEIDAGRMDPEGRGMTQIGRILGMIATILMVVSIVLGCLIFVAILAFGGFAASKH
jgi:predicted Zn finger-like uncharacterized protein